MTEYDKQNLSNNSTSKHEAEHLKFSKISPTAKLVAYFREFSDIPFAKEVSRLIDAQSMTEKFCPDPETLETFKKFGAPGLEARYKSMVSTIKRLGIEQVLELASGLSFRGTLMTEDPKITYVETDLSPMMAERMALIEHIPGVKSALNRPNLFLESVNALSLSDLEKALRHFNPKKPVAIIHEGLYQYLSMTEKKILANNIKGILSRFGGAWITPDFMTEADSKIWSEQPKAQKLLEQITSTITKLTGRNLRDNQFRDDNDIAQFVGQFGLKMQVCPQIDDSYTLTSLKKFPLPDQHLKQMQSHLKLWVLST